MAARPAGSPESAWQSDGELVSTRTFIGADGAAEVQQIFDSQLIDPVNFRFELRTLQLGATSVTRLHTGVLTIRDAITPFAPRTVHILLILAGGIEIERADGNRLSLLAGQAAIVPRQQRFRMSICTPLTAFVVSLDQSNLEELLPTDHLTMTPLSRDSAIFDPCTGYLEQLLSWKVAPSGVARYAAERITHELLSTLILDTEGFSGSVGGVSDSLRERAIAYIAEFKEQPDLSVEHIAAEFAISVRHLQRLFHSAGTTVTREIRRQRARSAQQILAQSRYDVLTIEQVAARTGFSDAKDLRRALVSHYNLTPRQLRQQRNATPEATRFDTAERVERS